MNKWPTRPTTDYAREGLFNILMNRLSFDEMSWLDLFGGTGIMTLEAISRGCPDATYVDRHGPAVRWMNSIKEQLQIQDQLTVVKANVKTYLKNYSGAPKDIIFCDPPYDLLWLPELPDRISSAPGLFQATSRLIIEHRSDHSFEDDPRCVEARTYGDSTFSLFHGS